MGKAQSKANQSLLTESGEAFAGLQNFGNTCYFNSVLQCLYYCKPFRHEVLKYTRKETTSTLLKELAQLFMVISRKRSAARPTYISPKRLFNVLKAQNALFSNNDQQDAQELLNYLLNHLADSVTKDERDAERSNREDVNGSTSLLASYYLPFASPSWGQASTSNFRSSAHDDASHVATSNAPGAAHEPPSHTVLVPFLPPRLQFTPHHHHQQQQPIDQAKSSGPLEAPCRFDIALAPSTPPCLSWVHDIFGGVIVNETKCLTCERVTQRVESFFELSVDLSSNSSIAECLRAYCRPETMGGASMYSCETCCSKQQAQKRARIAKLPRILAIHLKRFKYDEYRQIFAKSGQRVAFSQELTLLEQGDDDLRDAQFSLFAIVVHCGAKPSRGHYVSIIKSGTYWVLFDDDAVNVLDEADLTAFFGKTDSAQAHTMGSARLETAYLLFYQKSDTDLSLP